eukprot:210951-Pyramimonas_sp.AAC.1
MAEPINNLAGDYWKLFSNQHVEYGYFQLRENRWCGAQPYFDRHGMFISSVLSAPIMINVVVITGFSLYNMTQMMVKVKRAQLLKHQKAEENAEANSNAKSKSGSKKKN